MSSSGFPARAQSAAAHNTNVSMGGGHGESGGNAATAYGANLGGGPSDAGGSNKK